MAQLIINPTDSAHDGREASGGTMSLTGYIVLTSALHWAGLVLPSVALPPGATIQPSYLYYKSNNAARQDPELVWRAQAADTAAALSATTSDITSRATTTANVTDTATGIGTTNYRQVVITSLIAEVAARPGWASGNNMALIGDCGAACTLEFGTYDNAGAGAWYVEINYTTGGGVPVKMATYRRRRG